MSFLINATDNLSSHSTLSYELETSSTASSRKNQIVNDFIRMISSTVTEKKQATSSSISTSSILLNQILDENKRDTILSSNSNVENNPQSYLSQIEAAILRSHSMPIEFENELEEVNVNGEHGLLVNKAEIVNWKSELPLSAYGIHYDPDPKVIMKKMSKNIEYVQEMIIRYLRPPTPPAPGEIIVKVESYSQPPPAPPIIIRQLPQRPVSPECPLIIREQPPLPPPVIGKKLIRIAGKRLPPPPRKVVIERLAPLPQKPQSIIIERWLPYKQNLKRKVIFQKVTSDPVLIKPKNIIIQWQEPEIIVKQEIKYLGVIRADPLKYEKLYGDSLLKTSELPQYVKDIKTPDGLVLAADHKHPSAHELEGDLDALNLVDLDTEGLSQYKSQISKLNERKTKTNNLIKNANVSDDVKYWLNASEYKRKEVENEASQKTSSKKTRNEQSAEKTKVIESKIQIKPIRSTISAYQDSSDLIDSDSEHKKKLLLYNLNKINREGLPISSENQTPTNTTTITTTPTLTTPDKTSDDSNESDGSSLPDSVNLIIAKLFSLINMHQNEKILIEDAEKSFVHFNDRLHPRNRKFTASELVTAIQKLNRRLKNPDGYIELSEFRNDFKKLFFKDFFSRL